MRWILFSGLLFCLEGSPASYLPDTKHGECWRFWQREGITNPLPQKGTLRQYLAQYDAIERRNCYKQWLVLVYMAADNDLNTFSYRDLWEMESVGSRLSMDVLVFRDHKDIDGIRYVHITKADQTESIKKLKGLSAEEELAFFEKEGPTLIESPDAIRPLPEGDSGSVTTAGEFLKWAIQHYPSRKILLIGWSHAQGFGGGFALDENPDGKRGTAPTHMAVTEMAAGLRKLLKDLRGGHPLDILGSDACLNQQVEFAYEWAGDDRKKLAPLAQYVFGSSTIVQKKGFNYHILLDWLKDRPLVPTDEIAKDIPVLYRRSVNSSSVFASYKDPFATMATWETSKLIYLHRLLSDLAVPLLEWLGNDEKTEARTREFRNEVIAGTHRFGGISSDFLNFLQVLEAWASEKEKKDSANDVWKRMIREARAGIRLLDDSVAASYVGSEYLRVGSAAIKTSKGVALWLPTTRRESEEMLPKFRGSRFHKAEASEKEGSIWSDFVGKLYPKETEK